MRIALACALSLLVACSPRDAEAPPVQPKPVPSVQPKPVPPVPPLPQISAPTFRDPAAATVGIPAGNRNRTMAALEQLTREIDADTGRLSAARHTTDLGGGATGAVTVWRTGSILRRVHVDGTGTGFTSSDDYWMRDTVLIAAHLVITRTGEPPAEDRVWFRNGALYHWVDAHGEHRGTAARSTTYELARLRSRLSRVLAP